MKKKYTIYEEREDNISKISSDSKISELSLDFMIETSKYKYVYNYDSLGRPVIQFPQDIVAIQEIIWDVKPDLIIETGIAHGGSLILSASSIAMLDICDSIEKKEPLNPLQSKRKVLGIDIDIREHNYNAIINHPMSCYIEMIEGSSTDEKMVSKVKEIAKDYQNIMVILDSNHTHDHVLKELEIYAPLTSVGSYCVVFDTVIEDMPDDMYPNRDWSKTNNPKTAVWEYLESHPEFAIDHDIHNKLQITSAPDGYLKRKEK